VSTVEDGDTIKTPVVRFDRCEEAVRTIMTGIDKPAELKNRVIYAFSYCYDRAVDSGLIDYEKGKPILQFKGLFLGDFVVP